MNRHPKTVAIPHDPPHEVTISRIPGRKLRDADEERDFHANGYVEKMGGAPYRKVMIEAQAEAVATRKAAGEPEPVGNPLHAYDHVTLLKAGVLSWTLKEEDGTPTPVTPEEIEQLPADTLECLAEAILRHTKPGLFADFDAAAAQKKADGVPPIA